MLDGQRSTFGLLQTLKVLTFTLSENNCTTAATLLACTAVAIGSEPSYTSLPPSFQLQLRKGKETVSALMREMVLCCVTERGRDKLTDLQDVSTILRSTVVYSVILYAVSK